MSTAAQYYANRIISGKDDSIQVCLDFYNKRLRVDDYQGNLAAMLTTIDMLIREHAFSKVFVKTKPADWPYLLRMGYMIEGVYKGYFDGIDAYCMARYTDLTRRTSDYWIEEDDILAGVLRLPIKSENQGVPKGYRLRMATPEDAEQLADLYARIFRTYPTPMHDRNYVRETMQEGTIYWLVEGEATSGKLISAASAEINRTYRNAEMTDCTTLPEYQGKGLMRLLIQALERELVSQGIFCAYSLSRALSFGMNAAFHQLGYAYSGRLTKNCNIYDKFEDMNLWVKDLRD